MLRMQKGVRFLGTFVTMPESREIHWSHKPPGFFRFASVQKQYGHSRTAAAAAAAAAVGELWMRFGRWIRMIPGPLMSC